MTIILRPLINEKSMGLTKLGHYTFEVGSKTTKNQIAKVVADKQEVSNKKYEEKTKTGPSPEELKKILDVS